MAKGLNEIKIIGNVGQTPVAKVLENGSKVVTLSVATTKSYKDASGQKKDVTQWHSIVVWRKLADIVEQYVKKGDKVYFRGEMTYRTYEKDGVKRYLSEIVADDVILLSGNPNNSSQNNTNQPQPPVDLSAHNPDDLPF